jgi:hypothetical protein
MTNVFMVVGFIMCLAVFHAFFYVVSAQKNMVAGSKIVSRVDLHNRCSIQDKFYALYDTEIKKSARFICGEAETKTHVRNILAVKLSKDCRTILFSEPKKRAATDLVMPIGCGDPDRFRAVSEDFKK